MQNVDREIDITQDVCPMTFVRTRLELDKMKPGQLLLVRLKGQEPADNVPRTVTEQGHEIISTESDQAGVVSLLIRRGGNA
jgi:tRNA 2-thiouridine synthesizing protein A